MGHRECSYSGLPQLDANTGGTYSAGSRFQTVVQRHRSSKFCYADAGSKSCACGLPNPKFCMLNVADPAMASMKTYTRQWMPMSICSTYV